MIELVCEHHHKSYHLQLERYTQQSCRLDSSFNPATPPSPVPPHMAESLPYNFHRPAIVLTMVGKALSSASSGVLPAADVETYTRFDLNPCLTSAGSMPATANDTMPHRFSARPRSMTDTPGSLSSLSRSEPASWRMRVSMGCMPMSMA